MQITWYGLSCFKIVSGETTLLMSPFSKDTGLTPPRTKADIVLISGNEQDDAKTAGAENGFVISGEGEYEVKGVLINGFSSGTGTIYTLHMEGITLCHLDNASKEQIDAVLEQIGEVDILLVPIGGAHRVGKKEVKTLDAEEAVAIVSELEPRVVIPMYFKVPKVKPDLLGVESFLKAMGATQTETLEKFSAKKKDLPQEETKVVLLSCGT